jgi:CMP-2-keto-3-deoxyoctulosonic acid synthetase
VDKKYNSLLFSRSPIPFNRDQSLSPVYYEHIGVYAFRKKMLLQFTQWKPTPLELAEKIECLRYLENGVQLKMVVTEHSGVKIDVPEDLEKAIAYLAMLNK